MTSVHAGIYISITLHFLRKMLRKLSTTRSITPVLVGLSTRTSGFVTPVAACYPPELATLLSRRLHDTLPNSSVSTWVPQAPCPILLLKRIRDHGIVPLEMNIASFPEHKKIHAAIASMWKKD